MPNTTLASLARNQGIKPGRYLNEKNQATKGFSPAECTLLRKAYQEQQERTPVEHVANQLGISGSQAKKLVAEMFDEKKPNGLTAREITKLKRAPYLTTPDAPQDHKVKNFITRTDGITADHFDRAAKELGIVPKPLKTTDNRRRILDHYSPDQRTLIVELARKNSGQSPTDDQSTQSAVSAPAFDLPPEQPQAPQAAIQEKLFFFGGEPATE